MSVVAGHPARAEPFLADVERSRFHDRALWAIRKRRDQRARELPEWHTLRALAGRIKAHTLSASYEDVQPGMSTAYGVARTSELTFYPANALPTRAVTADQAAAVDEGTGRLGKKSHQWSLQCLPPSKCHERHCMSFEGAMGESRRLSPRRSVRLPGEWAPSAADVGIHAVFQPLPDALPSHPVLWRPGSTHPWGRGGKAPESGIPTRAALRSGRWNGSTGRGPA